VLRHSLPQVDQPPSLFPVRSLIWGVYRLFFSEIVLPLMNFPLSQVAPPSIYLFSSTGGVPMVPFLTRRFLSPPGCVKLRLFFGDSDGLLLIFTLLFFVSNYSFHLTVGLGASGVFFHSCRKSRIGFPCTGSSHFHFCHSPASLFFFPHVILRVPPLLICVIAG